MANMKYPEHEKLAAKKYEHEVIQSFFWWFESEGYEVVGDGGDIDVVYKKPADLIAGYFNIDPDKLEQEKQQMLDEIRQGNG